MRHLVLTLGLVVLAPSVAAADADRVARDFVHALKSGDVARAKSLIDTRYQSLPRDGVDALLGIESGYEPNLAFLVGQPFEAGRPLIVGNVRSEWYVLDGIHGQQVVIPLRFEGANGPFLLPSPVAFGRSMAFVDFMNFVKYPSGERYAALTLRLRPSVAPGRIAAPTPRTIEVPPPVAGGDPTRRPMVVLPAPGGLEGGLFGGPRPRDPGSVVLPSGEALSQPQLEALLPRLRAITIRLTAMQRGRFASWKVENVGFAEAVILSHGVEIPVR